MLAQPGSSRESEKVVLDGFNKKLAIKVQEFEACHPGVRVFTTSLPLPRSENFLHQGKGVAI